MKIFDTEIFFDSVMHTQYSASCPKGSGYCESQDRYIRMRKRYKFLGFSILTLTLEREHMPADAWISLGTIGYTGGWQSKWCNHSNFK